MHPKDAHGMVNSIDPDQRAPLVCVYTVCPDLSVQKLRIIASIPLKAVTFVMFL